MTGSGFVQSKNGRLQLQGSGGFSPHFPNISPANCFSHINSNSNCLPPVRGSMRLELPLLQ